MEFAIKAINGETPDNDFVATDIKIVNKDNIEDSTRRRKLLRLRLLIINPDRQQILRREGVNFYGRSENHYDGNS